MSVLDHKGRPVEKFTQDQLITAINTLSRRNQAQQMQIMQMGLLVEFIIEKLSAKTMPDGTAVFTVSEKEYEDFSTKRYAEIQEEAKTFAELAAQKGANNDQALNLEE